MEKKKIYITIFILVFIILLIIIGFAIFKKKSPADDKSLLTQIQRFMNILSTATENWFCISDQNTLKTIEDTYSTITTSYGQISLDHNIDPALTQAYNTLVNTYSTDMKTILTLPFCSDYCNEATFDPSKNICVCASGLTPIESGSKIYCSAQDCSSMTNSHFNPKSHSCVCNTGYQFNSDNTQCLYTNDELLKQYTQQLNDNLQKLETLIFNKPNKMKFNMHDRVHLSRFGTFSGSSADNMIINGHICGNDYTKYPPTYNITIDGVTMTGVNTNPPITPKPNWEFFRGDGKDQKGDPDIGWDTTNLGGCNVLPTTPETDIKINDITDIPESSLTYGWVTLGSKIMNHTKFNIHDPVHLSRPGKFSGRPADNMIINGHICSGGDDTKSSQTYNITIDGVTMKGVNTDPPIIPKPNWEFFRGDGKFPNGDPNIGWDTDWFGGCRVLPSESSDPGMTDIEINDITNIPESSLTYGWATLSEL